ncbi:hypothetical protein SLE2022_153590 [Rubroshorea leprosula]
MSASRRFHRRNEISPSEGSDGVKINWTSSEGSDGGKEVEITLAGKEVEITEMTHFKGSGRGKEDEMTKYSSFVALNKRICEGNRKAVEQFFVSEMHPLGTIILSDDGYTALHVAIQAGQDEIAEDLVKMMSETDLEIKTKSLRHTCLTLAASTGRTHVAKCIVEKSHKLLTVGNKGGHIPVRVACTTGQKEITQYLYSVTPREVFRPQNGNHGFNLVRWSIDNKMLDICLDLLKQNPNLSVTTDKKLRESERMRLSKKLRESPIFKLSHQPSIFFSGCKLPFWQIWIYHWLKVKLPMTSPGEVRILVTHDQDLKKRSIDIQVFGRLRRLGSMLLNFFGIKQIYDLKLTHLYALEILRCMCDHVSTLKRESLRKCGVIDAMFEATKQGIVEIVVELLKVSQPVNHRNEHNRHVFMIAIQHRQEKIFNLLYGIPDAWKNRILSRLDKDKNSMLHVAGEKDPDFQHARISNPALQMQRELQWFKEVESIVPEWCKEVKNKSGHTPYEVFSKSHKELVEEGEKWMKGTAQSFIIVGALIVTIMFAAAFTVPGGNNQNTGFPIFFHKRLFMTFIMSDAVSFFAASISVLMFLGILTSRFAQEDFLVSLPRKLIIGLSTLFISIAAMMVSFCATLLIMLQDQWWAIIHIIMMASIPVTLFIWLQFPLLKEIFVSTYAPGIFNRKKKPWLYSREQVD